MGLWLKCPGCKSANPLSLRVCPKCGRSLDNLPSAERVYIIGPPPEPAPAAHPAHRPQAAMPVAAPSESPKPAKPKQPKKPRKKKS